MAVVAATPRIAHVVSEGEFVARQPVVGAVSARVSDGELIQLAGTGDAAAFEELYARYARPVFGLALRRLGDRGRAEDAVQETFASIWRAARSYRPERGPGAPWLYAVARNAIVDRGRARSETPIEVPDEASADSGPDARAEESWTRWRVHRALEELPLRERRGDRARLLARPLAERGRRVTGSSARHGQDTHPQRSAAARRTLGR